MCVEAFQTMFILQKWATVRSKFGQCSLYAKQNRFSNGKGVSESNALYVKGKECHII